MYSLIAAIINKALASDKRTADRLASLAGKSLQLIIHPFISPILVTFEGGVVSLKGETALAQKGSSSGWRGGRAPGARSLRARRDTAATGPASMEFVADVSLEGHVVDWLRLLWTPETQMNALFRDRLHLTGDALLAQEVKALFDTVDIDWESILARWTGDLFAYQVGVHIKQFRERRHRKQSAFAFQLSNFLQEEIQVTPPKEAIADFCDEVDALVLAVERLEARLIGRQRD